MSNPFLPLFQVGMTIKNIIFLLQYLLPGGDDDQLGCTRYRRCWLRQQSSAGRGPLPYFTIASY